MIKRFIMAAFATISLAGYGVVLISLFRFLQWFWLLTGSIVKP